MHVHLIAKTEFIPPPDVPWQPDDSAGGEALAEFAGRACYQSWSRPNPSTATNAGYLAHIIDVGHLSVLEHGSVSFYITGVSRALTHELVRHRHFAYSQLSQRYVPHGSGAFVVPPELTEFYEGLGDDAERVTRLLDNVSETTQAAYNELTEILTRNGRGHKAARGAARAVLPEATPTRIVVTGNYRAWRHFIAMRATEHADVEIRALAVECLRQLQKAAANVFADFTISTLADGTEVASSPHSETS